MLNVALIARLGLLALLTVIVQVVAISEISIFGVRPDLMPLIVIFCGLLSGPIAGSLMGFAVGLLLDLMLLQTLGVSSLVFLAIGYLAGCLRELRSESISPLLIIALGGLATVAAAISFAVIQFLLGVGVSLTLTVLRDIVMTAVVNMLLSLPIYALVKWLVKPALPKDGSSPRRRRELAEAGLSPFAKR